MASLEVCSPRGRHGPGNDAGTDELTFPPSPAKFLRLTFAGNTGAMPADIAEIQAFSKAD